MQSRSTKAEVGAARQRVIAHLRVNGVGTTEDLAAVYGIGSPGNGAQALRRMGALGFIESASYGTWRMPARATEAQTPVAQVLQIPATGERAAAMKIHDLLEALRAVQGIEGFPQIELRLAELHLIRATDWLRGIARPSGQVPLQRREG